MPERVIVKEICDEDLEDVYRFLSENFDPGLEFDVWCLAFNRSWMPEKPNNGFMVHTNVNITNDHTIFRFLNFIQ